MPILRRPFGALPGCSCSSGFRWRAGRSWWPDFLTRSEPCRVLRRAFRKSRAISVDFSLRVGGDLWAAAKTGHEIGTEVDPGFGDDGGRPGARRLCVAGGRDGPFQQARRPGARGAGAGDGIPRAGGPRPRPQAVAAGRRDARDAAPRGCDAGRRLATACGHGGAGSRGAAAAPSRARGGRRAPRRADAPARGGFGDRLDLRQSQLRARPLFL